MLIPKSIWPYLLGSVPFLGMFMYQLAAVWPNRPGQPDPVNGYTVPMHFGDRDLFISNLDLMLMMGSWGGFAVLLVIAYRMLRRRARTPRG